MSWNFPLKICVGKVDCLRWKFFLLSELLIHCIISDRTGLKEPEAVEKIQDAILGAYKRYIAEKRPSQPVHWAKILMKVCTLRNPYTGLKYSRRYVPSQPIH